MTQSEFIDGLNGIVCRFNSQSLTVKADIERDVNQYLTDTKRQYNNIARLLETNDKCEVYVLGSDFSVYLPDPLLDWLNGVCGTPKANNQTTQ